MMDTSDAGGGGPSDLPPVDLEALIANYGGGNACLHRLLFIAEQAESEALKLDALRHCATILKQGENTRLYAQVIERIGGRLGPAYELDKEWVEEVDRRAAKRQEILDAELNGYKTNMIKESIRMGHNDLGDFFHQRGDLQSAFKCYVRSRDYCTTPRQGGRGEGNAHVVRLSYTCPRSIRARAHVVRLSYTCRRSIRAHSHSFSVYLRAC